MIIAVDHSKFKNLTKKFFLKLIKKDGHIYDLKNIFNEIVIKVSCILPINKDFKYLNQSIGSILNQTFQNFELIIILNTNNHRIYQKF